MENSFIKNVNKLANELPETGFLEYEQQLESIEYKLNTIEESATKNSKDNELRDRNTHTGTQSIDTITETLSKKIMTKEEREKLALLSLTHPPVHSHQISQVEGLEQELASKAGYYHKHDQDYYEKKYVDDRFLEKSDISHIHDDRYFTEQEINSMLANYATLLSTYTKVEVVSMLASKQDQSQKGQAYGYAELDSSGRIPGSQLPSLSIMEVFAAESEASMLLLSGVGVGDLCVRSDLSTNNVYLLKQTPSTDLSNWIRLSFSATVASVNGMTGIVILTKSDVGLGNVDNTSDADKPLSLAVIAALSQKADAVHNHNDLYEPKNINIQNHIQDHNNPHNVDKSQIGLGNVDNTSDSNKPLSLEAIDALSQKTDLSDYNALRLESFLGFNF